MYSAVAVSKAQNESEKYMHNYVGNVDFHNLLDCRKTTTCLIRGAINILYVPTTSANSERSFIVARLVVQEREISLNSLSVDCFLFQRKCSKQRCKRFSLEVHSVWWDKNVFRAFIIHDFVKMVSDRPKKQILPKRFFARFHNCPPRKSSRQQLTNFQSDIFVLFSNFKVISNVLRAH